MSLKRDQVTEWAKSNGDAIAKHRSQPLPKSAGGAFGRSVFGFVSQTVGFNPPSLLGRLSPTALFDTNSLLEAGKDYALSKIGSALNKAITGTNREWLETRNHSNLLGAATGYRFNHEMENRGFLSFAYPKNAYDGIISPIDKVVVGGESFDTFNIPFFENPKITESRSAEYASHKIINRNEPYRLWVGAKPKKVQIEFNITLPHLQTFAVMHMQAAVEDIMQTADFKAHILDRVKEKMDSDVVDTVDTDPAFSLDQLLPDFLKASSSEGAYGLTHKILTDISNSRGLGNKGSDRAMLILYCAYLLNIIQSSVLGSSNVSSEDESDPTKSENSEGNFIKSYLPAPVVFLNYGTMYSNEPFIATNYSMTFDGAKGYEELSLLPRVINIKLTLESFNQFEDSDKVFGIPKLFSNPDSRNTGGDS